MDAASLSGHLPRTQLNKLCRETTPSGRIEQPGSQLLTARHTSVHNGSVCVLHPQLLRSHLSSCSCVPQTVTVARVPRLVAAQKGSKGWPPHGNRKTETSDMPALRPLLQPYSISASIHAAWWANRQRQLNPETIALLFISPCNLRQAVQQPESVSGVSRG